MRRLQGGVATPVRVVSNRKLQKGAAIPVYVVTNRKHSGGIATPVYVVDSTHKIQGGEAIPVYEASEGEIESGAAIPVYVVEGVLGEEAYAPFSDGFGSGTALGAQWTGPTWAVGGGVAINSPALGLEQISNPEFTVDTDNWGFGNGATGARVDTTSAPDIDPTGGADNYAVEVTNNGAYGLTASNVMNSANGYWERFSVRAFAPSANTGLNKASFLAGNVYGPFENDYPVSAEDTWETLAFSGLSGDQVNVVKGCVPSINAGDKAYFDAFSEKRITFPECLATLGNCSSDFDMSVKIARSLRMACGLVVAVDNAVTPMNFLIVWLDGRDYLHVFKCLAGAYTQLAQTAITYVASAVLRIVKSGVSVDVYYNGSKVGSTITLTDNVIISGTRHGMFSTDPTVSMDDFSIDKKKAGNITTPPPTGQYANYLQYMPDIAGVMFSFDDADDSVYLLAYPILKAKRARGTFYIQTGDVGNAGRVSWANLTEMQNDGWSIANHTRDHTVLTGISQADAQVAIKNGHDDLVAQGMTAAHHLAYPNGSYDATVIAAAQAEGMLTGRHAATADIHLGAGFDLFTIGLNIRVTNGTLLGELYWWVDMAVGWKYITNFLIHRVDEAIDPTSATLTALVKYVTDQYIPIITIEDLYTAMNGSLNNIPIGP